MFQDRTRDNPQSMKEFRIIGVGQWGDFRAHQSGSQRAIAELGVRPAKRAAMAVGGCGLGQDATRSLRPVGFWKRRQDAGEKDDIPWQGADHCQTPVETCRKGPGP